MIPFLYKYDYHSNQSLWTKNFSSVLSLSRLLSYSLSLSLFKTDPVTSCLSRFKPRIPSYDSDLAAAIAVARDIVAAVVVASRCWRLEVMIRSSSCCGRCWGWTRYWRRCWRRSWRDEAVRWRTPVQPRRDSTRGCCFHGTTSQCCQETAATDGLAESYCEVGFPSVVVVDDVVAVVVA